MYALGKATEYSTQLRIDAVIDPTDTRCWIYAGLDAAKRKRPSPAGWTRGRYSHSRYALLTWMVEDAFHPS